MWESQELFTPPGNPGCSQGAGGRASEDAFPCNLRHRVPRGRVLPGGSRHQLPRTRQETPQTHQARAPAPLRAATGPAGSELRKQTWKLPGLIAPVAAASRGDATHSQAWASAHTRASPQTHSAHMRASHVHVRVTTDAHVRVPTSGHVHASSAHVRASSDTLGSHACVTRHLCSRACVHHHRHGMVLAGLLRPWGPRALLGPDTHLSEHPYLCIHPCNLPAAEDSGTQKGQTSPALPPLQAQWGRQDSAPIPGGCSSPSPSPTADQALPTPRTLPVDL